MKNAPVLLGHHTFGEVTDKIGNLVLTRPYSVLWWGGFLTASFFLMIFIVAVSYLFSKGVGIWGINIPVAWGFAITNFVWWIGIGHAGTFISAFLLLFRQQWRTSVNRFAEAMTIFAVMCAGLFPLLHLGRPWFFYWLIPYPSTMGVWPQFRSPLIWDVFAVSTYLTVSALFWYIGLVPDLASLRDKAKRRFAKVIFGFFALGWRNSARHWDRYETAYLLLAGLATPLVLSVHTVVSFDFTIAIVPGWHSTIFPPYFVAGAIFSGFAMVLTLAIPLRKFFRLEQFITLTHLENSAKLLLVTGLIVDYSYLIEAFISWYSGNHFEKYTTVDRALGDYAWVYWLLVACNVLVPQLFWSKRLRTNVPALFLASILVNVGMWAERFVIIVGSLHHDYMPSAWRIFSPTIWDWATLFGSIGLFAFLFLLFARFLPVIAIAESRKLVFELGSEKKEQARE